MPEQLKLQLNKTRDATPEEIKEWEESDRNWWGKQIFPSIIIATIMQGCTLVGMATIMATTNMVLNG